MRFRDAVTACNNLDELNNLISIDTVHAFIGCAGGRYYRCDLYEGSISLQEVVRPTVELLSKCANQHEIVVGRQLAGRLQKLDVDGNTALGQCCCFLTVWLTSIRQCFGNWNYNHRTALHSALTSLPQQEQELRVAELLAFREEKERLEREKEAKAAAEQYRLESLSFSQLASEIPRPAAVGQNAQPLLQHAEDEEKVAAEEDNDGVITLRPERETQVTTIPQTVALSPQEEQKKLAIRRILGNKIGSFARNYSALMPTLKTAFKELKNDPEGFLFLAEAFISNIEWSALANYHFFDKLDWPSLELKDREFLKLLQRHALSHVIEPQDDSIDIALPGNKAQYIRTITLLLKPRLLFGDFDFSNDPEPIPLLLAKAIGLALQDHAQALVSVLKVSLEDLQNLAKIQDATELYYAFEVMHASEENLEGYRKLQQALKDQSLFSSIKTLMTNPKEPTKDQLKTYQDIIDLDEPIKFKALEDKMAINWGVKVRIAQAMETRFTYPMVAPLLPFLKDIPGLICIEWGDIGVRNRGDAPVDKVSKGFCDDDIENLLAIERAQRFLNVIWRVGDMSAAGAARFKAALQEIQDGRGALTIRSPAFLTFANAQVQRITNGNNLLM